MDARRLQDLRNLFDNEIISAEEFHRLVREELQLEPLVLEEATPYELDICEVCGAIIRDAERLAHGCVQFRGRFSFETRVSFELLNIARKDVREGRLVRGLRLGAELFNALDVDLEVNKRRDPWWSGRPRRFVRGPWRPWDNDEIWLHEFRCDLDRALPIWAMRIVRVERLRPAEQFFGIDRREGSGPLAGRRLDVRNVAQILKDLWPQRTHPAYRREYQSLNISGNALRTAPTAAEEIVRVTAVHRESGRITVEGGSFAEVSAGDIANIQVGDAIRVVSDSGVPRGVAYMMTEDDREAIARAVLEGDRSQPIVARRASGQYIVTFLREYEGAMRAFSEAAAEYRQNRAARRGRQRQDDGSGFNGTPRELRVTRKRGR